MHDGVMYLMAPGAAIQALDATNGNLIWEYQRKLPANQANSARSKTIGMWEDMIYTTTPDSFLVALDAKTGELRWETKTDTRGNISGAVVAGDKIISGGSCTGNHVNCYISAHDAKTGKAAVEVRHRRQHRRARRRQLGQYSGRQTLRRNLGRARDLRSHHQHGDLGRRESDAEHAHGAPWRSVWRPHFRSGRSV